MLNDVSAAEKVIKSKWWGRGKTLKDLATSVGAADEYDWVYNRLSDDAHSGVRTFHNFIQPLPESSAQMYYRPQRSNDPLLPWSVTKWLCDIAAKTDEAYRLAITDTIGLALELAKSLFPKDEEV